jgi:hypothetical protein
MSRILAMLAQSKNCGKVSILASLSAPVFCDEQYATLVAVDGRTSAKSRMVRIATRPEKVVRVCRSIVPVYVCIEERQW